MWLSCIFLFASAINFAQAERIKAFVLHHPANVKRKSSLQALLSKQLIESEWVESWSAVELEKLNPHMLSAFYDPLRFLRQGEKRHWCVANPVTMKHVSLGTIVGLSTLVA